MTYQVNTNIRLLVHHSRGVSLIELLIAIVISSILVLVIVQVFSLNKRAFNTQNDAARLQESGRYAFNMLMQDIRRAGFFGGNANIDEITGSSGIVAPTNTCADNTSWGRMVQRSVIGIDQTASPSTDSNYTCIPDADYSRGDIIVLRYTGGIPASSYDNDRFYVRSSMFEGRLFLGSAQADANNTVSETPNAVYELFASAYYVGPSGRNCRFKDGSGNSIPVPSLQREILNSSGTPQKEEVAGGIEQLQFQYGVDKDDDATVDQYYNAASLSNDATVTPNWQQVRTVRFWVLARADCPSPDYTNSKTYTMGDVNYTPNDSFRRQLYSTTVSLRN